ncbi:MAG: hypothetical protein KJ963_05150 [Bacteroidetes bacterium]|nr:hypothetical protein [Bacteroidota bacterium]MBU2636456.1 hypothetical protein [Bacteroidota bacterium]
MKRILWVVIALVTSISLVSEFFIHHDLNHEHAWYSGIPFFYALFGFLGCLLLIFFAKYILTSVVQKKEDYYD